MTEKEKNVGNFAVTAQIDLEALNHNLQRVRDYAPNSQVLAMVKANAYGHGIELTYPVFEQADACGVARTHEGVYLRQLGYQKPIVVVNGFFSREELLLCDEYRLDTSIQHPSQLAILDSVASELKQPLRVWLKLETGMHRLGVETERVTQVYQQLQQHSKVADIILMTHFARADQPQDSFTAQQITHFDQLISEVEAPHSLANSAATIAFPESQRDWVRPGIMLYGASPVADKTATELNLRPVMTMTAPIIAVKHLQKGEYVGYSGLWQCPEAMPIAVVALGYADGIPRYLDKGTPVLVNGLPSQIIGRVSMDLLTIDLRQAGAVTIGDRVTIWGKDLPIDHFAQQAHTIAYEIFTRLGSRVQRVQS